MSAKDDIRKQIEAAVKRKKLLSKEVSRVKTISHWVSEFFSEIENTKKVDEFGSLTHFALSKLVVNIRTIDKQAYVVFKEPTDGDPKVEICWSAKFVASNNCEEVTVLDASSAFFQDAIERQD